MPEISHSEIQKAAASGAFAPVYLIYGEEVLVKAVFQTLLKAMLPGGARDFNYEPLDGGDPAALFQALERVNTFSMLSERKVVGLLEAQVFHSRQAPETLLEAALAQVGEDEAGLKAARHFAAFLAAAGMTFEDVQSEGRQKILDMNEDLARDPACLDVLMRACRTHKVGLPASQDQAAVLQAAVENGFPEQNHLLITTDLVDKRRGLYQAVRDHGCVVDCSVPKGERRADKTAQESIMKEKVQELLCAQQKSISSDAFRALVEMTGFDLRTLLNNLEKLIDYTGERKRITAADVAAVLDRTKVDPIFTLTNAVMDRQLGSALFYLDSLLKNDSHPLQILAALVNQMRRMIVVKGFAESQAGGRLKPNMNYNDFQRSVMPAVQAFDQSLMELLQGWDQALAETTQKAPGRGRKKSKPVTDLVIAKNPKSAYPVFQAMKNAQNFSMDELKAGYRRLSDTDLKMKTTGQSPKLLLEAAIIQICRSEP